MERTRAANEAAAKTAAKGAAKTPAKGKPAAKAAPKGKGRGKSGRPGGRPAEQLPPATLGTWIVGARPQTLALAIAPVALGTGAASLLMDHWYDHWVRALLALAVAVALQIGVNYANDYSDGVRGADRNRVGPQRLVGSGRAKPRHVLIVALVFLALGAAAGATLIVLSQQWWLFAGGVVALAAAWFYTGGPKPYGYLGLGELVSGLFFGPAAVAGTMFTQVGEVNVEAWVGGAALGVIVAAVMLVNNLRDRERDKAAGKRTLAVLLGDLGSRILYIVLMLLPFVALVLFLLFYDWTVFVFFIGLAALPAMLIVATAKTARELVTALRLTLLTALGFGVGMGAVLAFGGILWI
ncbi:MAG: 1,4-dihydroxy-2-naphthoate polyprenyltransferase [Microbacteriaceae bacterium]|nr:1,4-dihydroxy-2-naphthoate polyprenyltransferase [Microbacteriaceae bacterium]